MHFEDTNDEAGEPWEGKRLPDGAIEFVIRCDFDLTAEGHYEHRSTVWHGTNEPPGPDHGVWMIPSHPTGFEGDDIINGFLCDADGLGMFDEGESYALVVNLYLDTCSRPSKSQRRFIYRPGMFEGE